MNNDVNEIVNDDIFMKCMPWKIPPKKSNKKNKKNVDKKKKVLKIK